LRELAAAIAAVPILALVYGEALVRRLRLAGLLALPVLASVYALEMVRRPRLGLFALTIVVVPLLALGTLASAAPAALDARPPGTSTALDEVQLRPIGEVIADRPSDGGSPPDGKLAPGGTPAPGEPAIAGGTTAPVATAAVEPAATDVPGEGEAPSRVPDVLLAEEIAPPPSVVRFRPRGAAAEVDRAASLSVRFDRAMEREATTAAFGATIDGEPVSGTLRWAEDDTVLVLDPSAALPYGARVVLRVDAAARAIDGQPLVEPRAVSFTVEAKPTPAPVPPPEPRPAAPSEETGGSSAGGSWAWPLDGPITQYFGQSLTIYGTHHGLDINGETGDPIRAAAGGTVVVAGYYDRCGGLDVHIDHGDGLVTWYRHLSKVLVSVGQRVERGDLIGRVGSTGCSTGSHLHFAVRRGSTWLDPLDHLPRR